MAAEARFWILPFFLVGGACAWSWYWYIRSIIFYYKNGFDFSEDFGPSFSEFPDDENALRRNLKRSSW
jgi:hypothetical protein